MEKRVFLAIGLSLVVLALYQAFVPQPTPTPAAQTTAAADAPAAPGAGASGIGPATAASTGATSTAQPAAAAPVTPAADARDIVVDTDYVHAVFNTQGAVVTHWQLKKHLDAYGNPLDLVPPQLPPSEPKAFSLSTDDQAITTMLASAVYQPSTGDLTVSTGSAVLAFDYRDAATGLNVHKSFEFQSKDQPYLMTVTASIDVAGAAKPVTIHSGPTVGLGYNEQGSRYVFPNAVVQSRNGKVERPKIADASAAPQAGPFRFAGVGDHYFLNAALPGDKAVQVVYRPVQLALTWVDPQNRKRDFIDYSVASPGAASVEYFFGPKEFDTLHAVDVELVRTIDFGMFAFIVVPLLQALKWVNGFVHNFGWSIILLTFLINLVLFPLRHRSMVSMKKMQTLQPKVKAIQDRYAKYKITDPERQKMNTEMMALYKQHGANPASGCVPMLLTLPILLAFYNVLSMSIELRHAPFIGYITDLTRPDQFYITPLLMGATMFWQQRMMPSTGDPMQQKMMMFMPLFFMVSFLWAPSGLVLYWLTSNLLAIGQQALTNQIVANGAKR